jgi:hypothetical protein
MITITGTETIPIRCQQPKRLAVTCPTPLRGASQNMRDRQAGRQRGYGLRHYELNEHLQTAVENRAAGFATTPRIERGAGRISNSHYENRQPFERLD